MTLRKFLRFFKHFGYYMRKDFRWLKCKLSGKKVSNSNINGAPKAFIKILNKIKKTTKTDYFIRYGNKYYIPYAKEPWNFYEIYKTEDTVHITEVTTFTDSRLYEDGLLAEWISEVFIRRSEECNDELFAIKIKSLGNAFMVKETKDNVSLYKIYVKYGSQRPRLIYTINYIDNENGTYKTCVHSSKGGVDTEYELTYFPMQVLKSIPVGKL